MTDSTTALAERGRSIPALVLVLAVVSSVVVGAAAVIDPLMGIGLVIGLVYALAVLERPLIGVYTCLLLAPITAGLRRGLVAPGARLDEALLIGTFILVAGFAGRTRRWGVLDIALGSFALVSFGMPIFAASILGTPVTALGLQKMSAQFLFLLLFRLVRIAHFDDRQRLFAIKLLFAGTLPVVFVAFGQRLNLPGVRAGVQSLTDGKVFEQWSYVHGGAATRATGLFEDWHSMAGYLFPLLLVAVALLCDQRAPARWRRLAFYGLVASLAGIVAAQTITTLAVALAMAILVGAIYGRLGRTVAAMAIVGMFAVAISGGALADRVSTQFEDSGVGTNVEARVDIWTEDYLPELEKYWATGYGPEVPEEIAWAHTESLYVTLMLRGGFVLMVTYLVLTLVVATVALRGRASPNPLDRAISTAVFAAAVGSLAMHMVFPYITSSGFPHVFWLLVALVPDGGDVLARPTPEATHDVPAERMNLVGRGR